MEIERRFSFILVKVKIQLASNTTIDASTFEIMVGIMCVRVYVCKGTKYSLN